MSAIYLLCLLGGCLAMLAIDRRFGLYLFADLPRALAVQAVGMAGFLAWDLTGIGLGIFRRGEGPFSIGVELLPHLPLEEIVFLWFLCHVTMIVATGAQPLLARAARTGAGRR